jgi:hypothetical protein
VLELVPLNLGEARAFVDQVHRHHKAPLSGLFAIGAAREGEVVGVVIIGRPVARGNADTWTAEVTRLASDGSKNACSFLYAAAWRAARAMGYRRLITYTLQSEPGTSLIAAGWRCVGEVKGRSWNFECRPRVDKHPTQDKFRWEAA